MSDPCAYGQGASAARPVPISGLFADLELGIGALNLPDRLWAASGEVQLEVIKDWLGALERLRQRALMQLGDSSAPQEQAQHLRCGENPPYSPH